jgi:LysR family transcriptional regulator, nitrogen assimilation regulatory protein
VRHSRGIEPTEAGKLLHGRAAAILKQVDDTRRDVSPAGREIHESIRFGITPALMLSVGSDLIVRVRETMPQVSMSLLEAMSHIPMESLQRGELDYALCYDAPDVSQLARRAFLQEDLVFVALPGPERGKPIALVDVLDETLAIPEPADTVRQAVSRAGREIGLELKVTYEVRSISAMRNLALKGVEGSVLTDSKCGSGYPHMGQQFESVRGS